MNFSTPVAREVARTLIVARQARLRSCLEWVGQYPQLVVETHLLTAEIEALREFSQCNSNYPSPIEPREP